MAKRKCCVIVSVITVSLVLIAVVATVVLIHRHSRQTFKATFIEKCHQFQGYDCETLWTTFQQAYVGRDPCKVPSTAYDALIAAAPFPECKKMMLWSKTKDVVHAFTKTRKCFITVEDTMLGSTLDGLTWCGKEGSKDTFTTGCPEWSECENNPVRSFWMRVSAAFADNACKDVSVMLNGTIERPFDRSSIFASVELVRLRHPRVRSLSVVLVKESTPVANCGNPSLKDLQKQLDPGITYRCTEVRKTRIEECGSDSNIACSACWS